MAWKRKGPRHEGWAPVGWATEAARSQPAPCTGKTLQTTGFYVGRIVIVPREFTSVSSPPLRGRRSSKSAKLTGMRSLRHRGIYAPRLALSDGKSLGRGTASRWSAPGQATQRRDGRSAPDCPSYAMSSDRLFLDRVARQQSPSPLHRQPDDKTLDRLNRRIYHRTVTASFPACLTAGVHPSCVSVFVFVCVFVYNRCGGFGIAQRFLKKRT
jgi:hypothetical protein